MNLNVHAWKWFNWKFHRILWLSSLYCYLFVVILVNIAAPARPLNLTATTTDTSVTLLWKPSTSNGGREDVFYQIKYKTSQEHQFTCYYPTPPVINTSATITSLAPLTMYMFMVVAENGTLSRVPWSVHRECLCKFSHFCCYQEWWWAYYNYSGTSI